ncbi:MAG: sugar transferase [Syntrophobacteraceae bacterium]
MPPRTAVVLIGGPAVYTGHKLTERPRILLPIAGQPLLAYLAFNLREAGVKRLIICHSPSTEEYRNTIRSALANIPLQLEVITRETMLGTGGSIKQIEEMLAGESFWVLGGDSFMRADLSKMLAFHRARGGPATIAAVRIRSAPWQMERVETDSDAGVKAVHRMHPCEEKRSTLRPVSLYLFEPEICNLIPPSSYFDLKEQLFSCLYEKGKPASVWEAPLHSRTLVSVDEYFAANRDFLLGKIKFPEMGPNDAGIPSVGRLGPVSACNARLGENSLVVGPAVLEDCETGAHSLIVESIVLRNARIGAGAQVNHCLIGEGAVIEDGVMLRDAVIPMNSRITTDSAEAFPVQQETPTSTSSLKWLDISQPSRSLYFIFKRVIDVLFSTVALFLLSPLMLIIAIAVKLDSPGGAFFVQKRCGRNGRLFGMVKFRTMVTGADDLQRELMDLNEVDGPTFKLSKDPRVTRIGKFLRETNLDEIPQLLNVINGDMSLIGPRPLSMNEMCFNPAWRDARLALTPGITGLWQMEAHSKAEFSEWIRHDLHYARNAGAAFDTHIFFKTLSKFTADCFDFLWKPRRKRRL